MKPALYSNEDLQPLRDSITAQLDAEIQKLIQKGLMTQALALQDEPFDKRFGRIVHALDGNYPQAQKILLAAMQDLFLQGRFEFAGIDPDSGAKPVADTLLACIRHEPVLKCIESLVGPDIIGSSVFRIRGKIPKWEPGATRPFFPEAVPWHQDSGYMLAHCDGYLIVTCWIPLVDATIENGCMYVLPRKIEQGILPHYTGGPSRYLVIAPQDLPDAEPIPVEMKAGDVLFMTNMTPHASFDNNSDVTRWSMDLRYSDMHIPNNVDEPPESYTPERDPVTMACAPTEADFVIRDTRDPEREVVDGKTFAEIRLRYAKQWVHPGRGWTPLSERL